MVKVPVQRKERRHKTDLLWAGLCILAALASGSGARDAVGEQWEGGTVEPALVVQPPVATKPLPPRDCWRCCGPAACEPCRHHHGGFLYYGTYPWDDDPVNEFSDCPNGDCGHLGVGQSLLWIRLHQWSADLRAWHGRQPGRIGSYQHQR
ncbi:MAG: hypothetical protein ACYC0X_17735 [Pirellulaceae bacterium]